MRRMFAPILGVLVAILLVVPAVLGRGCARTAQFEAGSDSTALLPVRVYFPDEDRIVEMPLGEYLVGVVAAEMPPTFKVEALKAQFVAARTYTVRRMRAFGFAGGCSLHPDADVCASAAAGQAYLSDAGMRQRFGIFDAYRYKERLYQAEEETRGLILTYEGAPIEALYHSASGSKTADAEEYFGQAYPYLKPVVDDGARTAPRFEVTETFTAETLVEKLGADLAAPVMKAVGAGRSPAEVLTKTPTGRVATVRIGSVTLTGREFRERLGLRSTDFTVALKDGKIQVTTRGYGHGVGMSQYGANAMAAAGKDWRAILAHYYTGVRVDRIFDD